MAIPSVAMAAATVTRHIIHVLRIACLQVNAQMDRCLTVMAVMNAGPKAGLVMALQTVKINSMVLT